VGGVNETKPSTSSIAERQQSLLDDLSLFEQWEERYEYVISLGRRLAPMPEDGKGDEQLIKGCQSQVWVDADVADDGTVNFVADSDSTITKGMIALFVTVLNGQHRDDIIQADLSFIDQTGLKEHLAPTRANALNLMAVQMKKLALGC